MSYAYVSYQCAWLYTYYEKEWIRAYIENDEDRDRAMAEVGAVGYKIAKPDINKSGFDWELEGKILYPSLTTIKGIGDTATEELTRIRKECGEFKDLETFLYKPGERVKKKWRWSKFNKRAIDALIRLEAFDSLDCVGPDKMFRTYRHMHVAIIENFEEIKKAKTDLVEIASREIPLDWTRSEKIGIQRDLLGTYDKTLLFSKRVLDTLREYDILPLSDVSEDIHLHWFIVKNYEIKETQWGKPYVALRICDIDEKTKRLNYFGPLEEKIKKNTVYIAPLHINNGWLNVQRNKELLRIPEE